MTDPVPVFIEERNEGQGPEYQVRVALPREAEARVGHFASLVEGWAADCIGERRLLSP